MVKQGEGPLAGVLRPLLQGSRLRGTEGTRKGPHIRTQPPLPLHAANGFQKIYPCKPLGRPPIHDTDYIRVLSLQRLHSNAYTTPFRLPTNKRPFAKEAELRISPIE